MDALAASDALGHNVKLAQSSPKVRSLVVLNVLLFVGIGTALFSRSSLSTLELQIGGLVIGYLVVVWHWVSTQRGEVLEISTVFLAFFGMYIVLPIAFFTALQDAVSGFRLIEGIDSATVAVAIVALVGLVLGYGTPLGPALAKVIPRVDGPWNRGEGLLVATGFLGGGAVLVAALIATLGLETFTSSEYVGIYQAEAGLGVLAGGIILWQLGVMVLYIVMARRGGRVPFIPVLAFVAMALPLLLIGRRRNVLETGMALLVIQHFRVRKARLRTLVAGVLVGLMVFAIVGLARAYLGLGLSAIAEHLFDEFGWATPLQLLSEPAAVLLVLTETMNLVPAQQDFRLGQTFLDAFEILIPLPLHPSRPLAPTQWFVSLYDPIIASRGGSYSYAMIAEGYLNFGILGAAIVTFAEGVLLRALVNYRRAAPQSEGRLLIYAVALSSTVILIRGDFANLLKVGIVSAGLPAILAASWLGRRQGRHAVA